MLYVFGDFVLDTQCCELRCAGNLIKLEPLVFHVLAYLIQHRDRVVPKRELLEQLWPQQFVSDWALSRCITEIRRALGCNGRRPQFVKTLYGNGYRFIAVVTERLSDLLGSTMPRNPAALHTLTRDGAEQTETALSFLPAGCDQDELQLDAEPRQVTLLYGYLANTTALAETLGPAAMHSLRHRLFDLALRHVQRYAGTIQHFTETGFMALFGLPLTQGDHARRAFLTAVELHQALHDLSADHASGVETARALSCQFQVCLGLHTGQVMAWRHRSRPETVYVPIGNTTHLASQLARHAEPGTMLISETTAQRVQGEAVLGTARAVPLAGEATPVLAHTVLGMRAQSAPGVSPGARALSQFVGREQKLALLHRLLSLVENGRGQVVGIIGTPGMGKSRLVYEFRHSLRGKQVTYLEGHCRSYGSAIPSLPVLDLICNYCGITEADRPETIIEKVRHSLAEVGIDPAESAPYLLQFLEVQAGSAWLTGQSPEATRARTFALLRQMLLKRSQQQPLILVVEDLHWVDRTSQEVFAALVESLASVPIFLLMTYRPGYQPPWLTKSYTSQIARRRTV